MNVKTVARQVVDAFPADADFDDLVYFLHERSQVEEGRDDFDDGRTQTDRELFPEVPRDPYLPNWSQHAADDLEELRRTAREHYPEDLEALDRGVRESIKGIAGGKCRTISLPEMGDKTVLETRFRAGRLWCRVIFDTIASHPRVLAFTTGTSCYRNSPPRADEPWRAEPWPSY